MNTREEAIEYLQSCGFFAIQRDWVMGKTILVAIEPRRNKLGDLASFGRIAYIYPRDNALWSVDDLDGQDPYAGDCVPLKEACDIVMKFLRNAKMKFLRNAKKNKR